MGVVFCISWYDLHGGMNGTFVTVPTKGVVNGWLDASIGHLPMQGPFLATVTGSPAHCAIIR